MLTAKGDVLAKDVGLVVFLEDCAQCVIDGLKEVEFLCGSCLTELVWEFLVCEGGGRSVGKVMRGGVVYWFVELSVEGAVRGRGVGGTEDGGGGLLLEDAGMAEPITED